MTAAEELRPESFDSVTEKRLLLRRAGYDPIPAIGKDTHVTGWSAKFDVGDDDIKFWPKAWADHRNTGVLTKRTPCIDIDILNPDAADAVEMAVRERCEEHGDIHVRFGKSPKRAIFFRTDEPFNKIAVSLIAPNGDTNQKIEFLGSGQQVIVDGIHPDTGKPYSWHGVALCETKHEDLPYIREAEAREMVDTVVDEVLCKEFGYQRAAARPKDRAGNGGDAEDWQFLFDNIRNGHAVHDSLRDLAAKLIASGMTAGAAVNMLRAAMQASTAPRDARWQERYDDIPRLIDGAARFAPEPSARSTQPPPQQPRNFTLKAFDDIKMSTASSCIVRGLIPRGGLVVVWGPPKCGKSFLVFDLTMHIALGWDYRGHRVQQGAAVYLALEGGSGFAKRVEAWRQRHLAEDHDAVPFWLLDVPVDVIADRDRLEQTIKAQLAQTKPAVVVIDTLNRGLNGSENKPEDMARFIQAADIIREAFGCSVIIVHHCGIAGDRPRGHTSLQGAADAQIAVVRDEKTDVITATVEFMKDDEPAAPLASRLERVELGEDDDEETIASCIIVEAEATAASKRPKLTGMQKLALEQLQELVAEMGTPSAASNHIPQNVRVVPKKIWREYFRKRHPNDDPDTTRKAFVRAVAYLQEHKFVGLWGDEAWLADKPDMAGHS
jgi:hypothetical protein